MKSVAANALLGEPAGQGERLGQIRLGAMERRIEAGDLWNLRRSLHDRADRREVVRLMQRGERLEFGEIVEHSLVHPHRRVVFYAAVDHAVTKRRDRPSFEQCASRRDDLAHGGVVIESLRFEIPLLDDCGRRRQRP